MSTHKAIDRICLFILAITMAICVLAMNLSSFGVEDKTNTGGYETHLFTTDTVHTINVITDEWESFLETCTDEEYIKVDVLIDNELYKNVAFRAKGNTSLTNVANYGNDRYSFKIEFDHYDKNRTYYGLDKLCLNNIIQDNTYMKDYLCYTLMQQMGVDAPLCSYVQLSVNGEVFGLYLAVEGIEDAFLRRNYGSNEIGDLYKPDSSSMGGERGNGKNFNMEDFQNQDNRPIEKDNEDSMSGATTDQPAQNNGTDNMRSPEDRPQPPNTNPDDPDKNQMEPPETQNAPEDSTTDAPPQKNNEEFSIDPNDQQPPNMDSAPGEPMEMPADHGEGHGNMNKGMGSDDVKLIYSDDDPDSYPNIFDNAKTTVSEKDKKRLLNSLKALNEQTDLESVLDTDEVLRYFAVHNFVCNFDSYTGSMIHNYYLYEQNGQLSMIPWDYNLAFGTFMNTSNASSIINYPIDSPVSTGSMEDRPMVSWIFSDETYIEEYHARMQELVDLLTGEEFRQEYDRVVAMIDPYVQNDPTSFCTYEEFKSGTNALKEFLQLRSLSVQKQLDGTLGSTTETQQTEELVDAGDLDLNDLGGTNNGRNGPQMDQNNAKTHTMTRPTENMEQTDSDTQAKKTLLLGSVLALSISLFLIKHIKRKNV